VYSLEENICKIPKILYFPQTISKCCQNKIPTLSVASLTGPEIKKCKGNKASLKIFNEYYLNRQQNAKANNSLSFSDSKLTKAFAKDSVSKKNYLKFPYNLIIAFQCFVNCLMNETGVVNLLYMF
jgi:hypothetical protein